MIDKDIAYIIKDCNIFGRFGMKRDAYQKLFKAGIATALVASAVVVTPTSEVHAQKESGKNHGKDHGKNQGKGKKQTPKVDKSKLQTAISYVSKLKKADYTVDSWNKLQQALAAAQKVIKDSKATQASVTKALNNLQAATNSLVVLVDKSKLQSAINHVSKLKKADYTVDSWNKLQQALSAAQRVVQDSKATQASITKALSNLQAATNSLVVLVDKSKLQTVINNVSKLKKDEYTVDSWNKLQQALSAAQRVVQDSKATQASVTKAFNNLTATLASLVLLTQPTDARVNNFKELKEAINNPKIKNIFIQSDIKVEESLKITSEKNIYGNGYSLYGARYGRGYISYLLQFSGTVGSLTNININDADAAVYVDGSTVTLSGKIDVSGNNIGGIVISGRSQSLVNIVNSSLVNRDEANYKPTILEERIESTNISNKVVGYDGMFVDYNQNSANHLQRFYYLNRDLRAPNPINGFTLSLMHSNDTHANLNQIAKKVTAVKEVRAAKPKAVLVDAGDVFSGTSYFNEFKGLADLQFMNLMGYDIMTFGDHEFDLGSSAEGHQALVNFINGANFSFVSSNIDFSRDAKFNGLFNDLISSNPKNGKIYSGIVKEIDGQKVGFFGLTTADTRYISNPGSIAFENYIEEAKKAVIAFEGMGVNKIVAITHIGYDDNPAIDNDLNLAALVEGIDVIVGGHSHTQLNKPVVVDEKGTPTIIVQAGHSNEFLGTLDVEFDKNGVIIRHDGKLIKIVDKVADKEATSLLKPYKSRVD